MKILLVLLFAVTFPIVLFLSTILYGGITSDVLKTSLSEADIYANLSDFLAESAEEDESADSSELEGVIMEYITPDYAQQKTEEVIDTSYDWITGSTTTTPTISFPEIKEQVMSQNPELLTDITAMTDEMKNQPASAPEGVSYEELAEFDKMGSSADMLTTFVKNDFSMPLGKPLTGIKQTYDTLRIVQPILLILIIVYLVLLGVMNTTWPTRLKWIGSALMLAGVLGFVAIALQSVLLSLVTSVTTETGSDLSTLFLPIATEVMRYFVKMYTNYQGIASVALFIAAAICFVIASLYKNEKPAIQPVAKKKKK